MNNQNKEEDKGRSDVSTFMFNYLNESTNECFPSMYKELQ